jgi:hypothetical protein
LRAKELFSTALVEIAVEIFLVLWKKPLYRKFSTFPQPYFSPTLWKCGKLKVKYMKAKD